jgi:hypothetical protein
LIFRHVEDIIFATVRPANFQAKLTINEEYRSVEHLLMRFVRQCTVLGVQYIKKTQVIYVTCERIEAQGAR